MTTEAVREITIRATPATVFAYLVDPKRLVEWMGTDAVLQPVPGGEYRVICGGVNPSAGHFVEVVPDQRVVFTFGWDLPGHLIRLARPWSRSPSSRSMARPRCGSYVGGIPMTPSTLACWVGTTTSAGSRRSATVTTRARTSRTSAGLRLRATDADWRYGDGPRGRRAAPVAGPGDNRS